MNHTSKQCFAGEHYLCPSNSEEYAEPLWCPECGENVMCECECHD